MAAGVAPTVALTFHCGWWPTAPCSTQLPEQSVVKSLIAEKCNEKVTMYNQLKYSHIASRACIHASQTVSSTQCCSAGGWVSLKVSFSLLASFFSLSGRFSMLNLRYIMQGNENTASGNICNAVIVLALFKPGTACSIIWQLHRARQRRADAAPDTVRSAVAKAAASHTGSVSLLCIDAVSVARYRRSCGRTCRRVYAIALGSQSRTAAVHTRDYALDVGA